MDESPKPDALLLASLLCKRFGGVVAAKDIDFSVAKGELRCVIGPNGAGKSTFFSLLSGVQRVDSGRVTLLGKDITGLTAFQRVRRGLGLTFQTNRTFHSLTVRQNLEVARRVGRIGSREDEQFLMALRAFGLPQQMDVLACELPHHQQQWLEIAMALCLAPAVLLLDEPTAGMSTGETRETARVLRRLAAAGLAIVVVEHDMAFVRDVASSVTVLHQGMVFAEGSVDSVTADQEVRRIYLGRVKDGR